MKARKHWIFRALVLLTMLGLAAGAVLAPLVFTETLVSNFLRVLELVARLS